MDKTVGIFVYGTLKVGNHFAKNFDALRLASLPGKIKGTLYRGPFFPMLKCDGAHDVEGELHTYKRPSEVLAMMDRIEGYEEGRKEGNFYVRKKVEVTLENGRKEKAFVYEFNESVENAEAIPSGRWD